MDHYQFDKSSRSGHTLRTSKDPKSLKSKSSRLWNRTPTSFKTGEVTGRAAKKVLKGTVNATPRIVISKQYVIMNSLRLSIIMVISHIPCLGDITMIMDSLREFVIDTDPLRDLFSQPVA